MAEARNASRGVGGAARTRRPRVGPARSRDYLLAIAAGLVVGTALGSTLPLPLLLLLMLSFLADRRPRRISTVQIVSTAVADYALEFFGAHVLPLMKQAGLRAR